MKIKELLKKSPGILTPHLQEPVLEKPQEVIEANPGITAHQFYENLERAYLERQRNTPWFFEQHRAIALFSDRRFKLRKKIVFGNYLVYPRGSVGRTLSRSSLKVFNEKARNFLLKGLEIKDTELCYVEEYVWVLPLIYMNFGKDKHSETMDLL